MPDAPVLLDADTLRESTRSQYRRVFRWLCTHYDGPWDRTEPLQRFLDDHPEAVVRSGIRGRIVQCLVNRHLEPRPAGPPIFLSNGRRPPRGGQKGARGRLVAQQWMHYLPHSVRSLAETEDDPWSGWLHEYVVTVLRANPLRRNLVRTYVAHVYRVLWDQLHCRSPDDMLGLQRDTLAQAVADANATHPHQRRLCRIAINHFLGGVVFREHPPIAMRLHLRTRDLPDPGDLRGEADHPADYAVTAGGGAPRDHFTNAEMDALLALPTLSSRDRLMLRIMSETGLRRRAVSWLLVEGVFDRAAGQAQPVARAIEKGLVTRAFVLSVGTQGLLATYIGDVHPGPHVRWLFPSPKAGHTLPVTPAVVNNVLLRACRAAGIQGRHTHTHAVRKFVVCRLMQAHNRIEDIAKWIGHRTVDLTFGTYWDVDARDVAAGMTIPWL